MLATESSLEFPGRRRKEKRQQAKKVMEEKQQGKPLLIAPTIPPRGKQVVPTSTLAVLSS